MNINHRLQRGIKKSELSDGLQSVSDIQDYFEFIIKKHETLTYNSPIRIYINKTEKRTTFREY